MYWLSLRRAQVRTGRVRALDQLRLFGRRDADRGRQNLSAHVTADISDAADSVGGRKTQIAAVSIGLLIVRAHQLETEFSGSRDCGEGNVIRHGIDYVGLRIDHQGLNGGKIRATAIYNDKQNQPLQ